MDLLTRKDLDTLMEAGEYPRISIYMPAEVRGQEVKKNAIMFKTLLEEAEHQAGKQKFPGLFDPAHALIENSPFWSHQEKGLAVFLSPELFRYYRLPLDLSQQTVVTDRFHVKPLLELFTETGEFYILAFSMNTVRLLRGSRFSVSELDLQDLPEDMATALRFDVPRKHMEFHTGTSSAKGEGRRPAMFHGQGTAGDKKEHKKNILRYFQKIDKAVHGFLKDSNAPLVLAGVDYLIPLYMEANSYNQLLPDPIKGNPERIGGKELHDKAWEIVEPHFHQRIDRDKTSYTVMAEKESDLASSDHKDILKKAYRGKVEVLFAAPGRHKWGRYDPEYDAIRVDAPKKKDSEDLLELAAVHAIRHGARVYTLAPDKMPGGAELAAIFRK
ncbi:MAG: hypothetical protein GF392_01405 [Candidatus Omnitrophica bacterium]|nr:hypothetical protein [Candidatus Omnitrophota bacterium]